MGNGKVLNVQLPFTPRPHQRDAHRARKRFTVQVWHRRAGKTVYALVELILAALEATRERSRFAYVAPLLKQAKMAAWDYLRFYTSPLREYLKVNESELSIDFPNGSRIRIFGADDPDSLRSIYYDGVVLDEVAQMKPDVWGAIVRPALADRQGWALFIGTPKGTNLFSELYYRALQEPGWHADLRRWSDTNALAPEEIEAMRREMTPAQWAQEMECDFSAAAEDQLISLADVQKARVRTVGAAEYEYAPRITGVDVARYGGDRAVIFARQGCVALDPIVFAEPMDLMSLAGQVARHIDQWKPHAVFVDQGGMGAGVVDRLRQLGFGRVVLGVDFANKPGDPRFAYKRDEMWWLLADWVRTVGCLPDRNDLAVDLTGPTYSYANARGKLQVESKDSMKSRGLPSPDLGDALALTFAEPVAVPTLRDLASGRSRSQARHDFDPFAEGSR